MLQAIRTVCFKQWALFASSNAPGVTRTSRQDQVIACCKCTYKAMADFCTLFFCWNWSCHCHCHAVKVVTPLLLLQWKAGADMALKGTPSWLCISSQAMFWQFLPQGENAEDTHILVVFGQEASNFTSTKSCGTGYQGNITSAARGPWQFQFVSNLENVKFNFSVQNLNWKPIFGFQFRIWSETFSFWISVQNLNWNSGFQFRFWTQI